LRLCVSVGFSSITNPASEQAVEGMAWLQSSEERHELVVSVGATPRIGRLETTSRSSAQQTDGNVRVAQEHQHIEMSSKRDGGAPLRHNPREDISNTSWRSF
jgi:hypothetical protein